MFVCTRNLSGRIDYKLVTVLASERKLRLEVGGALLLTVCFPCTGSLPDPPAFLPGALCPRGGPVGSAPAGNWRKDGSVSCCPDFPSVVLPEVGCVPRLVRRPGHTALLSQFWNSPLPLPSGLGWGGFPTALPLSGPPRLYETPSNYPVPEHPMLPAGIHTNARLSPKH